jgi:hypothetical protein
MELCLEEVVSNVIRHGYGESPNYKLLISYAKPGGDTFALTVEDEALSLTLYSFKIRLFCLPLAAIRPEAAVFGC